MDGFCNVSLELGAPTRVPPTPIIPRPHPHVPPTATTTTRRHPRWSALQPLKEVPLLDASFLELGSPLPPLDYGPAPKPAPPMPIITPTPTPKVRISNKIRVRRQNSVPHK